MKKKAPNNSNGASKELAVKPANDFTADLITLLNKEQGERVAYNLATDMSPTHIKRWIPTGCVQLDYIISNRRNGGVPEGRVIEIFGPPSIGKSHLAIQIAKNTQAMGGVVVYIDTENATQIENLVSLGVDVSKRFVFCEVATVEEVFQVAEKTIVRAKQMSKDVPITIIWDSIAATPPKSEVDGDYDDQQIGAQARAISKGMRKITQTIGANNVTFIALNQQRTAIGVMFGDPMICPGGKSVPYHASVRIKLGAGQQIKDQDTGRVIGINVSAKTIKNKVAAPFREANFEIHFGKGVVEHAQLFDLLRVYFEKHGPLEVDGKLVSIGGTSGWKNLTLADPETGEVLETKKFTKNDFGDVMNSAEYGKYVAAALDAALVIVTVIPNIDAESYVEVQAIADEMSDSGMDELST